MFLSKRDSYINQIFSYGVIPFINKNTNRGADKSKSFLKFEGFHFDENLECGLLGNDSLIKEATFFPEILPHFLS